MEQTSIKEWAYVASLAALLALPGCNEQAQSSKVTTHTPSAQPKADDSAVANSADQLDVAAFVYSDTINALVATGNYATLLTTTVNPCSGGGTVTVAYDDIDPAGPSTGDSYTSTYADCVYWGSTLNGTNSFKIDELSGDPTAPAPAVWMIKTTAVTDLLVDRTTSSRAMKGTHLFAAGTSDGVNYSRAVTGDSTTTRTQGTTTSTETRKDDTKLTWNLSNNSYSNTISRDETGGPAGDLTIETLEILTGTIPATTTRWRNSLNPPTAGKARVTRTAVTATTATKSIQTFTALSDGTVQTDIDSNGDGVVDTTTTGPWPYRILYLLGLYSWWW